MRLILLLSFFVLTHSSYSQHSLVITDISQKQLRLLQKAAPMDSAGRHRLFVDSLYKPYSQLWEGYMGDGDAVAEWMSDAIARLPELQQKNELVDGKKLLQQFRQIEKRMIKLTGYRPKGNWYIIYGPAWTDLGGLGDFAMLIDLSHESNRSNERIVQILPHELTHQIMTNVNKHKDSTAISPIIGEGFAVWMNQYYWKKYTLAENLGYTQDELEACEKNLPALQKFFLANKYSTNKDIINAFRSRSVHLNPKLPGAIGYYIGYKIVEAYVQKHGPRSWKDVFVKSPREIYEESGFGEG
ncbi:MAG: DUF2268 domain-containing putative Zn-dependent protease [Ferruginibacter sp.]